MCTALSKSGHHKCASYPETPLGWFWVDRNQLLTKTEQEHKKPIFNKQEAVWQESCKPRQKGISMHSYPFVSGHKNPGFGKTKWTWSGGQWRVRGLFPRSIMTKSRLPMRCPRAERSNCTAILARTPPGRAPWSWFHETWRDTSTVRQPKKGWGLKTGYGEPWVFWRKSTHVENLDLPAPHRGPPSNPRQVHCQPVCTISSYVSREHLPQASQADHFPSPEKAQISISSQLQHHAFNQTKHQHTTISEAWDGALSAQNDQKIQNLVSDFIAGVHNVSSPPTWGQPIMGERENRSF